MRIYRLRIEILLLGAGIACAVGLLLATMGGGAGVAAAAPGAEWAQQQDAQPRAEQTYEGVVTCSRCGARHSAVLGQTAADCARLCVRDGAHFALVESNGTYLLEGDISVLARLAGQRARVVGELDGKTIRISSVAPET